MKFAIFAVIMSVGLLVYGCGQAAVQPELIGPPDTETAPNAAVLPPSDASSTTAAEVGGAIEETDLLDEELNGAELDTVATDLDGLNW